MNRCRAASCTASRAARRCNPTPQNFFQDINLALPWPNPITLDAAGRIPQLFIADGLIKIRLTDAAGVVQLVADNVQVIGSSSGGGGGGTTFDPLSVFLTGDIKARYGVGIHPGTVPGWVRCNGYTIGAAGSGATELPHANCQPLFEYLWGADTNLVVSGGRGANAHADWLAGKQLALPDYRGYALAALDDMGNSAAGRYAGSREFSGTNADDVGSSGRSGRYCAEYRASAAIHAGRHHYSRSHHQSMVLIRLRGKWCSIQVKSGAVSFSAAAFWLNPSPEP